MWAMSACDRPRRSSEGAGCRESRAVEMIGAVPGTADISCTGVFGVIGSERMSMLDGFFCAQAARKKKSTAEPGRRARVIMAER